MTTAIATPIAFELYPCNTTDRSGREVQASQSLRLAAVSEVSKDITLRTREGDTATLSMDRETVAVYGRDARMAIDQPVCRDWTHWPESKWMSGSPGQSWPPNPAR